MHVFLKMLIGVYVTLQCSAIPRQIIPGEVTMNCVIIKVRITYFLLQFKMLHKTLQGRNNTPAVLICVTKSTTAKKSIAFYNLKSNMYLITRAIRMYFIAVPIREKKKRSVRRYFIADHPRL